mmetsp:Transcript_6539/g.16220  ORF Transcript_6539/g.16220 Transcript_6539/m.16220 type:complete len:81 (+) Transcript_6539:553-795(+)
MGMLYVRQKVCCFCLVGRTAPKYLTIFGLFRSKAGMLDGEKLKFQVCVHHLVSMERLEDCLWMVKGVFGFLVGEATMDDP